jgi:hypothetical protein
MHGSSFLVLLLLVTQRMPHNQMLVGLSSLCTGEECGARHVTSAGHVLFAVMNS